VIPGILAATAAIILYGTASLSARWPAWRILAFSSGTVIIVLGTVLPMPSLAAHMAAHGAVVTIGAALIVLGQPVALSLRALPRDPARRVVRALRSRTVRILAFPPVAWIAFVAVQVAFHLPPLFESALVSEPVHVLEHLLFVVTAIWFWTVFLAVDPLPSRWPAPVRAFLVLAAMPMVDIGGIRLMTTGESTAGASMLAAMMPLAYFAAGILWVSLFEEERRAKQRANLARTQAIGPVLVLMACGFLGLIHAEPDQVRAAGDSGQIVRSGSDVAPDQGQTLFQESCSSCHGFDGEGVPGRGPSLTHAGAAAADFYLRTGRMPMSHTGTQPIRARSRFSERELLALVDHVARFGTGPGIPEVDPDRGDIAQGRELFASNCAACHGMGGAGGVVIGAYAPPLDQATPTDVAEAIRIGPYLMPRFNKELLDDSAVDSIAKYVELIQDPDDRGGWGIGHVGPVPEGLVAWFGGILAALLIARALGSRRQDYE
jgi:ubiquinol-cytochrome c reductase cytochrome c subunit